MLAHGTEQITAKRAAVARLYESHFERVVRYIAARIGNPSDSEDLASEVFVRALRSVDSFKETGAPMEAWIFKIARNIAVDYLRSKGRRPTPILLDDAPPLASPDNSFQEIERREEVVLLRQAMQQLTEAQREVLALRFGSEMTSQQAAAVLGKKPTAIREMQSAAIKKLREILRGEQPG
ncbi:MAG: sigma-70 family RNA polymerase sigma factor [Chloroflexota bacterium]|nr:sigma-70 family RNA polymerase sigma factor [Chloroflexota bacterium]